MEHHTSNEKFSSNQDWRNGLDQLCALPDEEKQDMNAAWDKLNTRLFHKKTNKKFIGYWIAAASVAAFILIAIITIINKKEPAVQGLVKNNQPIKNSENKKTALEQLHETVVQLLPVKDKKNPVSANKMISASPPSLAKTPDTLFQVAIQKEDSLAISSIIPPVLPNKPISFPALKKKLPVVHINDIDKPLDPVEAVAGNDEHAGLRIRLFSKEIHMESPVVNNDNNNALKIKLSPQN